MGIEWGIGFVVGFVVACILNYSYGRWEKNEFSEVKDDKIIKKL